MALEAVHFQPQLAQPLYYPNPESAARVRSAPGPWTSRGYLRDTSSNGRGAGGRGSRSSSRDASSAPEDSSGEDSFSVRTGSGDSVGGRRGSQPHYRRPPAHREDRTAEASADRATRKAAKLQERNRDKWARANPPAIMETDLGAWLAQLNAFFKFLPEGTQLLDAIRLPISSGAYTATHAEFAHHFMVRACSSPVHAAASNIIAHTGLLHPLEPAYQAFLALQSELQPSGIGEVLNL